MPSSAPVSRSASQSALRFNRRDALDLWHRAMLDIVLDDAPDLTLRQFVILSSVYLGDGPHTVRSLAGELKVTKAVVTRALDTLTGYGYVTRGADTRDRRSIVVNRTAQGSKYLSDLGDMIVREHKLGQVAIQRNAQKPHVTHGMASAPIRIEEVSGQAEIA